MISLLLSFFVSQASAFDCVGCKTELQKQIQNMSFVDAQLDAMKEAKDNVAIIYEGMDPKREVRVPTQVTPGKADAKAIVDQLEAKAKASKDVDFQGNDNVGIILLYRAPRAFSMRSEGRNQVSVSTTASNTMLNGSILEQKETGRKRSYYADTVGEVTNVTAEKGDKENEFSISYRIYNMLGKPSLLGINEVASDHFIEDFHSAIGFQDPYHRRQRGMDFVVVDLRDANGNQFKGQEGATYVLPLVVKRGYFQTLREDSNSKTTLNYGVQGQVPIQQPFGQAGAGVYANVSHNQDIGRNQFLSFAAGVGLNVLRNFDSSQFTPYDGKTSFTYNASAAVAYTCIHADESKTSFVVSGQIDSPVGKRSDYKEPKNDSFTQFQSNEANFRPIGSFGVALVHETKKGGTFTVGVQEDYGGFKNKNGGPTMDGLNHQDFTGYVKVTKKF